MLIKFLQCSFKFNKFNNIFKPHSGIKAHVIDDFIIEFVDDSEGEGFLGYPSETTPGIKEEQVWEIHVDGSPNSRGSSAGVIIID